MNKPNTNAIRLSSNDNVVVARTELIPGESVDGANVIANGHIGAGHKVATENIAKKAKSQGNRTEKDGKYFNKAYGDEDNSQKQKHDGWYVSFLRLVAEQVLHDDFDTRIFEDQIEPGDIGDEGKCKRHVKIRIGGANQWFLTMK